MLQFLISVSKAKRMGDELGGSAFWVGAQLSEQEIKEIDQMSKRADEVNLLGYQTCLDHDGALAQAFKAKPTEKIAALIKFTLDPKSDYLPLRQHLTIPEAEHMILLEDGIGVHIVACTQSELRAKVDGKPQTYKLIEMESRVVRSRSVKSLGKSKK